jgi:hypothetical protein
VARWNRTTRHKATGLQPARATFAQNAPRGDVWSAERRYRSRFIIVVILSGQKRRRPLSVSRGGLPMLFWSVGKCRLLGTGLLLAREIRGGRIREGGEAIARDEQPRNAPRPRKPFLGPPGRRCGFRCRGVHRCLSQEVHVLGERARSFSSRGDRRGSNPCIESHNLAPRPLGHGHHVSRENGGMERTGLGRDAHVASDDETTGP